MLSFFPFVAWVRRDPAACAAGEDIDSATLLEQWLQGQADRLDEIYRREAGPVYRYALALCGNAAWAAEATQEAFIALATRPRSYVAERGSLGAWLAGAARHALLVRWREGRNECALPEGDVEADLEAQDPVSPETLLLQRQSQDAIWTALRRLPAPFREAVVLVDLQERPYDEAARIAGIELNTLRTRVHRGRLKLAALLGADPRTP